MPKVKSSQPAEVQGRFGKIPPVAPPSDQVTRLLNLWQGGDREALDAVIPLIYDDLRAIARKRLASGDGKTLLQPTVLVHEAYIRIAGRTPDEGRSWRNRVEFFALIAKVLLHLTADLARKKSAAKYGGGAVMVTFDGHSHSEYGGSLDLMVLKDILARLESMDRVLAQVWMCRHLCGLSIEEIGDSFQIGQSTVHKKLKAAGGWITRQLEK